MSKIITRDGDAQEKFSILQVGDELKISVI